MQDYRGTSELMREACSQRSVTVDLSFIIPYMKDKLTDLCGNWLLPKDIIKTLYEMRLARTLVKL